MASLINICVQCTYMVKSAAQILNLVLVTMRPLATPSPQYNRATDVF